MNEEPQQGDSYRGKFNSDVITSSFIDDQQRSESELRMNERILQIVPIFSLNRNTLTHTDKERERSEFYISHRNPIFIDPITLFHRIHVQTTHGTKTQNIH